VKGFWRTRLLGSSPVNEAILYQQIKIAAMIKKMLPPGCAFCYSLQNDG